MKKFFSHRYHFNASQKTITLFIGIVIFTILGIILCYKKTPSEAPPANAPSSSPEVLGSTLGGFQASSENDTHLELNSTNIIWFTNQYRMEHGLNSLQFNTSLRDSAYNKSRDMFRHNYFAHNRPSNDMGFDNFVDNQGYVFIKIAENLARGEFVTSKAVVDAWIKSPTHRANILDAAYTEIGVSVDRGVLNGKEVTVITQHFGKPKHTCPHVDDTLHTQIQSMNRQLTNLKKNIDLENGQVEELIEEYNTIIRSRVPLVATYNAQVLAFDACIIKG
jgi:uncharacterized protein YkwD